MEALPYPSGDDVPAGAGAVLSSPGDGICSMQAFARLGSFLMGVDPWTCGSLSRPGPLESRGAQRRICHQDCSIVTK